MANNEELIPCPQCGSETIHTGYFDSGFYCYCTRFECGCRTNYYKTVREAEAAWNQQAKEKSSKNT